jgi:hypothetical protein
MSKFSKFMAKLVMGSAVMFIIAVGFASADFWIQYGGSTVFTVETDGDVNMTADLFGFTNLNGTGATVQFDNDVIEEGDIAFSTACASGNHYYLNGNDLACEADDDVPDSGDFGAARHLEADGSLTAGVINTSAFNASNSPSNDDLLIVNNTNNAILTFVNVPDCDDTGGNHLNYDSTTQNFSCGTTGDGAGGLANVVEDTTPQLGGDLDIQSYKIYRDSTATNMSIDASGNFIITLG